MKRWINKNSHRFVYAIFGWGLALYFLNPTIKTTGDLIYWAVVITGILIALMVLSTLPIGRRIELGELKKERRKSH